MSAIEQLGIALQHDIDEQYQYQPGEIIRGNIVIKLGRPMAIKSITVKVYGEGNASWKNADDDKVLQAQEIYVDAIKSVVDTVHHEPLSLSRGTHEFSYDYILPENIPSSYIGKYGNVTYTMRVTVTGVKSVDTAISSEPFLVLRRSPLPPPALEPLVLETDKRMWSSCSFGKLHIRVALDKTGGVPGEDVFLQAEIKNHSRRTVTAMQASLLMTSLFRAQSQHTEFRQVVSKKRDEFDVTHMEGRRWNYVRLTLPPYIPESKLECCDIIELDYLFQFRVELSGGSEVRLEAPFWIGAQPQGLEVPEDERMSRKINRQWTVRAKGVPELQGDSEGDKHDYDEGWGVEVVPEMRSESAVISNPLYRNNSFMAGGKGIRVMPEEFIENTKL